MSELALVCTEKLPVPPIRGGAIQTYIDGVLPFLQERHQVTVFSVADRALPDREERAGVRYVRAPRGGGAADYFAGVAERLGQERWDLVLLFNRPAFADTVMASAPGARLVLSMHNEMFHPHRLPAEVAHTCLERAEAVVTISDYIRDGLASLYPAFAHKLRTIRSGVDLGRFQPIWSAADTRLALREREGLAGRPVILAVTRLSEKKGVHVLLSSMKQVLRSWPHAVLLVAGSRWYGSNDEDDYVRYVKERAGAIGESVRLSGYVPYAQIPETFLLGDLFVCASQWQEPLARVHYEAMATGLPIITTDRGGNAEVIEPDGNGIIVRPHDRPEAFAEAACSLLGDGERAAAMGRRGRALAEARYGWARVAAELLEVLEGRWP